jgi:hypothetical protein
MSEDAWCRTAAFFQVRGASFTIFRAYGSIALTNRVDFLRGLPRALAIKGVYPCLDPVDVLNCFDDLFIDRVHVVYSRRDQKLLLLKASHSSSGTTIVFSLGKLLQ